jgi:hypothetical protein
VENVEDKIAVHCPDEELWDKVQNRMLARCRSWATRPEKYRYTIKSFVEIFSKLVSEKDNLCMFISTHGLQANSIKHWEEKGYKIISAQEYLNEGGKDVSEFKVGDKVELIGEDKFNAYDNIGVGDTFIVSKVLRNDLEIGDKTAYVHNKDKFKIISKSTKTQTTKENNMNINSSIRTVLERLDDIEAKRLEKEEKDK